MTTALIACWGVMGIWFLLISLARYYVYHLQNSFEPAIYWSVSLPMFVIAGVLKDKEII